MTRGATTRGGPGWGKGHEAGYQWASSRGIENEADCVGSESFAEGCRVFVAEQAAQSDDNSDDNKDSL